MTLIAPQRLFAGENHEGEHVVEDWVLDERLDFVFRQSNVSGAELCGGRVALDLQHGPFAPTEAMFGGTGIHLVIDHLIDNVLGLDHWDLSVDAVMDDLETLAHEDGFILASRFTNVNVYTGWVEGLIDMGHAWLEQWGEPNMPLIEAAIVREDKLFMPLGYSSTGVRLWLSGHPDLATPHAIIDWKTSTRNWPKGKAQGAIQDDLYSLLVESNYPEANIGWGAFIVGDRSSGKWHENKTLITQQSKDAARERALRAANQVLEGHYSFTPLDGFGKRNWHCKPKFCATWDLCPYRYLGDEFDNQPEEDRSLWL